jgi:hypothetical protein
MQLHIVDFVHSVPEILHNVSFWAVGGWKTPIRLLQTHASRRETK